MTKSNIQIIMKEYYIADQFRHGLTASGSRKRRRARCVSNREWEQKLVVRETLNAETMTGKEGELTDMIERM